MMMNIHKPTTAEQNITKKLTKHSIEQLTSPGSDCENGSDGGPSSPKKHKDNTEKIVSYTEMIAKAIFSSPNNMSTLAEIYNYLIVKYPILSSRGKSWKNSVRHTLSLNEWFVKIPKLDNAKCCYWSIHPVYIQRFRRGDFQKQRKASVVKIRSHQNHRYYDLGYDVSPTPDYHFMSAAGQYQSEISSGISPHGSFSPWPMHPRPYEMQSNFFPTAPTPYSTFPPMYNVPPSSFPPMYPEPSAHQQQHQQQYTNLSPSVKQDLHSNSSTDNKYLPTEDQFFRGENIPQYNDFYIKQENNNQHQNLLKSVQPLIQSATDNPVIRHPADVGSTLDILSNAALSTQPTPMQSLNTPATNMADTNMTFDMTASTIKQEDITKNNVQLPSHSQISPTNVEISELRINQTSSSTEIQKTTSNQPTANTELSMSNPDDYNTLQSHSQMISYAPLKPTSPNSSEDSKPAEEVPPTNQEECNKEDKEKVSVASSS